MLSYDDEKNSLAEALDKYSVGVPPVQWLPWIPQLLACLVQYDGNVILNLLSHVSVTMLRRFGSYIGWYSAYFA